MKGLEEVDVWEGRKWILGDKKLVGKWRVLVKLCGESETRPSPWLWTERRNIEG